MLICKRCGNTDKNTLYIHHKHLVCKRCIRFGKERINSVEQRDYGMDELELNMLYELTPFQKECSKKLMSLGLNHDVVVEAVCGAGKTEIVLDHVRNCLEQGCRIGWAIPRRQVVLELCERLTLLFPKLDVIAVCEGFTENLEGDLILMTTHQLYRYQSYFDYLIIDEVDAFPYSNNETLKGIAKRSYTKNVVYLSATIDPFIEAEIRERKMEVIRLNIRPSYKPLPVPKEIRSFKWHNFVRMLSVIMKAEDQYLIFMPTIKMANRLSHLLKIPCVTSKTENKEEIIERFREKESRFLITTTVLERGVTFKDISVIVFQADHLVFSVSSLIQIAGRVGRGISVKDGECLFYTQKKNINVLQCIERIEKNNISAKAALSTLQKL